MPRLILIRHGQSLWNQQNRFTGWVDVDLSEKGLKEARNAGRLLMQTGYTADLAFTSVLKRAIRTLWIALEEMDRMWIPQHISWRLNERHYGALQGLDKAQTAAAHGDEQVHIWRRSYDVPPPPLPRNAPGHPRSDPRYRDVDPDSLPDGESLKDTLHRVLPYWESAIGPALKTGRHVMVAAHGNSLRALLKHLLSISDAEIPGLEIPTGNPLALELKDDLSFVSGRYLDPATATPLP